jgi:hypothetical protein
VRLCSHQSGCQENWNKSLVSLALDLNLAILTLPKEDGRRSAGRGSRLNLSFPVAESFLVDRDRMDLESVPSLRQTGKFLLADQGGAVVRCV